MESHGFVESFFDLDDAQLYMEKNIREYAADGWELKEGSGIAYVNYQYRVGLVFERKQNELTS